MSDISEINLLKELVRKHTKKHGGNSILCIDGTYLKGYGKLKNIRLNNHDIGQTTQHVLQDRVKNVTSPPKMNHPLNLKEPEPSYLTSLYSYCGYGRRKGKIGYREQPPPQHFPTSLIWKDVKRPSLMRQADRNLIIRALLEGEGKDPNKWHKGYKSQNDDISDLETDDVQFKGNLSFDDQEEVNKKKKEQFVKVNQKDSDSSIILNSSLLNSSASVCGSSKNDYSKEDTPQLSPFDSSSHNSTILGSSILNSSESFKNNLKESPPCPSPSLLDTSWSCNSGVSTGWVDEGSLRRSQRWGGFYSSSLRPMYNDIKRKRTVKNTVPHPNLNQKYKPKRKRKETKSTDSDEDNEQDIISLNDTDEDIVDESFIKKIEILNHKNKLRNQKNLNCTQSSNESMTKECVEDVTVQKLIDLKEKLDNLESTENEKHLLLVELLKMKLTFKLLKGSNIIQTVRKLSRKPGAKLAIRLYSKLKFVVDDENL